MPIDFSIFILILAFTATIAEPLARRLFPAKEIKIGYFRHRVENIDMRRFNRLERRFEKRLEIYLTSRRMRRCLESLCQEEGIHERDKPVYHVNCYLNEASKILGLDKVKTGVEVVVPIRGGNQIIYSFDRTFLF